MTSLFDILSLKVKSEESNETTIKQEVYDQIDCKSAEFHGISGITTQGNPTLVYLLPMDNSLCYKFCQKRANGITKKISSFYCVGCKSKAKNVSIYVSGNMFMDDPSELTHVCQPKTTSKELAATVVNEHLASIASSSDKKKEPRAYFDDLLELCQRESKIPENIRTAVVEKVAEGGHRQRRKAYSRRINKPTDRAETEISEDIINIIKPNGFSNNSSDFTSSLEALLFPKTELQSNLPLQEETEIKRIKLEDE